MWCGNQECEMKMREEAGVTSRCIPYDQIKVSGTCPICHHPADQMVVWGVAY